MCRVQTTSRKPPVAAAYVSLIELSLWMVLD